MVKKLTTLIFCSDKLYDELINVVYFLCSALLLFSRKFSKTVTGADPQKMAEISAPSNNTRTSLVKSAKGSAVFFKLVYLCKRHCQMFKSKTRIVYLTGNARHEFENHQYFIV